MLNKPLTEGSTSSKVTLYRFLTLSRCNVDGVSLDFHSLLHWKHKCCLRPNLYLKKRKENNSELMRLYYASLKKSTDQICISYYVIILYFLPRTVFILIYNSSNHVAVTIPTMKYYGHNLKLSLIFFPSWLHFYFLLYWGYSYSHKLIISLSTLFLITEWKLEASFCCLPCRKKKIVSFSILHLLSGGSRADYSAGHKLIVYVTRMSARNMSPASIREE